MLDQYFGTKELYEVVLKAKLPMVFGSRRLEAGEPVLYFENISLAMLREQRSPIIARGGWSNMPRVIWEDSSEIQFTLSEGVMSSISMAILLSSTMLEIVPQDKILVPKREGPYRPDLGDNIIKLEHWPSEKKKTFIYEYARDVAQKKIYGKRAYDTEKYNNYLEAPPRLALFENKECDTPVNGTKEYIIDYYYEYIDEAIIYLIQKERFNGLFTLEGKFYSKDENEGMDYTNLIYMPKVRVVSNIDLRLGERANPTVATFNIIGLPEKTEESNNMIVKITRLNQDIDEEL